MFKAKIVLSHSECLLQQWLRFSRTGAFEQVGTSAMKQMSCLEAMNARVFNQFVTG